MFDELMEKTHTVRIQEEDQDKIIDDYRANSGKTFGDTDTAEVEDIRDKYFDILDPYMDVHAINPEAKFIYLERKNDPRQYANIEDLKADIVEGMAVGAMENEDILAVMKMTTVEELDNAEKGDATSEIMVIPEGSKFLLEFQGLEPEFFKTVEDLIKAIKSK